MMTYDMTNLTKEEYEVCKKTLEEFKRAKAIKECYNYLREIIAADIDAIGFEETHGILEDLLSEMGEIVY